MAESTIENIDLNAISSKQKGQIVVPILLAGGLIFMANNKMKSDKKTAKRTDRYERRTEYFILGFVYFLVFSLLIQLYIKMKLSTVLMVALIFALLSTFGTYWHETRMEAFSNDEEDEDENDENEDDEDEDNDEETEADADEYMDEKINSDEDDAESFTNVKIVSEPEPRSRSRKNKDRAKKAASSAAKSKSSSKKSTKYPKSILKKKNSKSRKVASVRLLDDSDTSDMSNNYKHPSQQMLVSNHRENKNYSVMNGYPESNEPTAFENMGSYELL